jgi:hypothetical protein
MSAYDAVDGARSAASKCYRLVAIHMHRPGLSLGAVIAFDGRVSGHIYAQPLYWHGSESNRALLFVATEDNIVQDGKRR